MSLPSPLLDAFTAVAKAKGFSSAAKHLHITQSALSQRIKNLEEVLGLTLFVRTSTGALLTEQGERLLRYCQTRGSLEEELMQELSGSKTGSISGTIRLASYSSVFRSVLIPALKPLLEKYPNVLFEFACTSMPELPGLLQRAEVDFIVMDYFLEKANLQRTLLGHEQFVIIENKRNSGRNEVFLDNDAEDRTTERFFKSLGSPVPKYRRSYCGDCYGIIDGVVLGLGRAVMSKHLVVNNSKIKVVKPTRPYKVNVVLHYYQQPFYSKLHQSVVEHLTNSASHFLLAE